MKMNTYLLSHLAQVLLEWEMLQTNLVVKIKTYISFEITFSKMPAFWKNLKKYIVEPYKPQITKWRMRILCWIPKATDETQNM